MSFALRLVQFRDERGMRGLAAITAPGDARLVRGVESTLVLAHQAVRNERTLAAEAAAAGLGEAVDLAGAEAEGRLLAPIDHPDPAHPLVTGTGLTHLGSAEGRDQMHRAFQEAEQQTDSMRMFLLGAEGGRPEPGTTGVQPEWFYKGDGSILVGGGAPLLQPDFAEDGGEEPEIAGIYLIDSAGQPRRLGFALANEFSDHVLERRNYLYLAHSKLRPAALGPELLTGALPADVRGVTRIRRGGEIIWQRPFLSGELNMTHTIANLERHHFKYPLFRQPGSVHVHVFGTATLSFTDGVATEPGDVFELSATPFGMALRNSLVIAVAPINDVIPL